MPGLLLCLPPPPPQSDPCRLGLASWPVICQTAQAIFNYWHAPAWYSSLQQLSLTYQHLIPSDVKRIRYGNLQRIRYGEWKNTVPVWGISKEYGMGNLLSLTDIWSTNSENTFVGHTVKINWKFYLTYGRQYWYTPYCTKKEDEALQSKLGISTCQSHFPAVLTSLTKKLTSSFISFFPPYFRCMPSILALSFPSTILTFSRMVPPHSHPLPPLFSSLPSTPFPPQSHLLPHLFIPLFSTL